MRNVLTDELKQNVFEIETDFTKPFYLVAFGDVHKGAENHADHDWQKFQDFYEDFRKSHQVRFIGVGDYIEFCSTKERAALANPDIHESTISLLDKTVLSLSDEFKKDLEWMGTDLLGLIEGNHRFDFSWGETDCMYLCRQLGCQYLAGGWYGKMKFVEYSGKRALTRHTLDIYAAHGAGNALTISGSINKVQRFAGGVQANIYLLGHDHQHIAADIPMVRLDYSKDGKTCRSVEYPRRVMRTGSFYRTFNEKTKSYAVNRLYAPSGLGNAEIEVRFCQQASGERYLVLNSQLRSW